jgi:hypothetical protein
MPTSLRDDMRRRLSVVMAVAALDTYMHRLIVDRAYEHGESLPGGLARLDVPFERLLAQADETTVAARADPHYPRPPTTSHERWRWLAGGMPGKGSQRA